MPESWELRGKYSPHLVEERVLEYWEKEQVYRKLKERENTGDSPGFNFIDGPPYPSGDTPHLGTAWNKSLKDVVLRYKRMKGFKVYDKPGYDCHGLPIEVKVEQKLGIKVKKEIETKLGVERFVEECRRLATNNLTAMTRWFKELGVFMDWEDPYLTMRDEYIEAAWALIKKADEQGLLDKEMRVVYWCPRCSTTLAEYEVEYKELEDPSIYVKFPVEGKPGEYLVIWTTTPWTLPANTFVMAHPDEMYVKIRINGEVLIVAEKRLETFIDEIGAEKYEVLEKLPGSDLVNIRYIHPLEDLVPLQGNLRKYHKVVLSREHVSMDEGTGLVHGAPGHGFEDFEVARENGIKEIASPVDEEGVFTSEAGKYAGLNVRTANEEIIKDLAEKGALIHRSTIKHRYPVCWRCKTPVVLRATEQWVIRVTELKERLIDEARKVEWIPKWGLLRLESMLKNLQDWVISRQRYWGTPLPVWTCPNGHRLVLGSMEDLIRHGGEKPKELHRPWIDKVVLKCPVCGLEMKRVPDVLDVWLDSGVAFYASKGHPSNLREEDVILDFIVEGHDQVRGWFFSLLRSGVLMYGKAPYRTVLIHGFMLDEQGREMHKSLGNYVGTDEAIAKVGRDPLRIWLLRNTTWEDARFSWGSLEEVKRDLSILWNIYAFAKTYMELDGYDPLKNSLEKHLSDLRVEDRWLLSRVNTLVKQVTEYMEKYEIHSALRAIVGFYIEDLSHWYIRLIRPRVWVEENTSDKIAAYATLYYALDRLLRLLAPFAPFVTEYIYQAFMKKYVGYESVHMLEYPKVDEKLIDKELEEQGEIIRAISSAAGSARMRVGLKLRQPVKEIIVFTDSPKTITAVEKFREALKLLANAKYVRVEGAGKISSIVKYSVEPVYKSLGPRLKGKMKKALEYISSNPDLVARDIIEKGEHEALIDGEKVVLTKQDVAITPEYLEGYSVAETSYGVVAVNTKLTMEEIAEGLAREMVRRIQVMRKELALPLDVKIDVVIVAPADKLEVLRVMENYIKSETRASSLRFGSEMALLDGFSGHIKEWEIEDESFLIGVKQVE